MSIAVRPAVASDADFLAQMLVAAAFWRPGGPSGSVAEVLSQPELGHYVVGWPRQGDLGVIALGGQQSVGAALGDADAARLSPLIDTHLNVHGSYTFFLPQLDGLRPLRDPTDLNPDTNDE